MEADHRDPDQVAALMAWIERHDPAVVAVDGFGCFRRLRRTGLEAPDQAVIPAALGGPPAALEVYPYGASAALLGALPPSEATRDGLRLRM